MNGFASGQDFCSRAGGGAGNRTNSCALSMPRNCTNQGT
jgi:hypothetical protein